MILRLSIISILYAILWGAWVHAAGNQDSRLEVFVSVDPVRYLVDQIGGTAVHTTTFVPPNREPDFFEPTPREVSALAKAAAYLSVGLPFESILEPRLKDSFKNLKIVNVASRVMRLSVAEGSHSHHSHDVHHQHLGDDPHVWTSPNNLIIITQQIAQALTELIPTQKNEFERRSLDLISRLESLSSESTQKLSPYRGQTIWFVHGAWQYFLSQYGLRQQSFEIHGKEPTPRQFQELLAEAKNHKIKILFVQPQFKLASSQMFKKQLGLELVELNPNAYDVVANLRDTAEKIADALGARKHE